MTLDRVKQNNLKEKNSIKKKLASLVRNNCECIERKRNKYKKSCTQPLFLHQIETNLIPWGYLGTKPNDTAPHLSFGCTFMDGRTIPIRRLGQIATKKGAQLQLLVVCSIHIFFSFCIINKHKHQFQSGIPTQRFISLFMKILLSPQYKQPKLIS